MCWDNDVDDFESCRITIKWSDLEHLLRKLYGYCLRPEESDWVYWFNVKFYIFHLIDGDYCMQEPIPDEFVSAVIYVVLHHKHWTRKGFLRAVSEQAKAMFEAALQITPSA